MNTKALSLFAGLFLIKFLFSCTSDEGLLETCDCENLSPRYKVTFDGVRLTAHYFQDGERQDVLEAPVAKEDFQLSVNMSQVKREIVASASAPLGFGAAYACSCESYGDEYPDPVTGMTIEMTDMAADKILDAGDFLYWNKLDTLSASALEETSFTLFQQSGEETFSILKPEEIPEDVIFHVIVRTASGEKFVAYSERYALKE